jgi:hypothetical protein
MLTGPDSVRTFRDSRRAYAGPTQPARASLCTEQTGSAEVNSQLVWSHVSACGLQQAYLPVGPRIHQAAEAIPTQRAWHSTTQAQLVHVPIACTSCFTASIAGGQGGGPAPIHTGEYTATSLQPADINQTSCSQLEYFARNQLLYLQDESSAHIAKTLSIPS